VEANWNATSDTLVKKGRAVQIIAVEGLWIMSDQFSER